MNLREFNEHLGQVDGTVPPVTDQAIYDDVIELVYAWHPAIPDQGGKIKIAKLYALGGIGLLEGMCQVAIECRLYEERINAARRETEEAAGLLREVRRRFEPAKVEEPTLCDRCCGRTNTRHVLQTATGALWVCETCVKEAKSD